MQAVGAGAVVGKGNTYTPNVNQGRGASHVSEHERSKGKPAQNDPANVKAAKERTERVTNAVKSISKEITNSVKDNLGSIVVFGGAKESVRNAVFDTIQKKSDQLLKVSKEIEKVAPKIANNVGNTVKTISKALANTSKEAGKIGNEVRKITRDVIKNVGKNTGELSKVVKTGSYAAKNLVKAAAPAAGIAMNVNTIVKNESNFKSMLAATDIAGDCSVVLSPFTSAGNLVGSLVYDALPKGGKKVLDDAYDPNRKIPQKLIDIRTHNYKSTPHERSRRNSVDTNSSKSDTLKKNVSPSTNNIEKKSSATPAKAVITVSNNSVVKTSSTSVKSNPHTTSHIAAASVASTKTARSTTAKKTGTQAVSTSRRSVSSNSSAKSSSNSSSSKNNSSSNNSKKSYVSSSTKKSTPSSSARKSTSSSSAKKSSSSSLSRSSSKSSSSKTASRSSSSNSRASKARRRR